MNTLTLNHLKTSLLGEDLCDQMKKFSVGDNSEENSSQDLFVGSYRTEQKKNFRGRSNSTKVGWWSKASDGRCHHCKKPDY